jgi:hypothetical protein
VSKRPYRGALTEPIDGVDGALEYTSGVSTVYCELRYDNFTYVKNAYVTQYYNSVSQRIHDMRDRSQCRESKRGLTVNH